MFRRQENKGSALSCDILQVQLSALGAAFDAVSYYSNITKNSYREFSYMPNTCSFNVHIAGSIQQTGSGDQMQLLGATIFKLFYH